MLPRRRHAERYRAVAAVFARHGVVGIAGGRAGLGRVRRWTRGRFGLAGPEAPYTEPEHVRLAIEELGVTFIKLGQILSTRPDLLPPDYIVELAKLQEAVPPVPAAAIREVIERELGKPVAELFATFDDRPLASASIGQVHAATLRDGAAVVVKVQKPGVEEQVATDLAVLRELAHQIDRRWALWRRYDMIALLDEFAWTLRAELDYVREGRNAERFAGQFREDGGVARNGVRTPAVHWPLTTRRVLTMERVEGTRIDDVAGLDAAGIDRHALAERAAKAVLRSVFEHGFFHADPHPGNYLVAPDGTVIVLDFGMVGELPEESRRALVQLLGAVTRHDAGAVLDALADLGVRPAPDVRDAFRRDIGHLLDAYYGLTLGEISATRLIDDVATVARRHALPLPAELALLTKMVAMHEGVGRVLDPDFSFAAVAEGLSGEAMRSLYSPGTLAGRAARSGADAASLALDAPVQLRRILRQVASGDFEVRLRRDDIDRAVDGLSGALNRLAASIVGAAIAITLALILQVYHPPAWQFVAALGLLVGPVVVALLWSWAMLSTRDRD